MWLARDEYGLYLSNDKPTIKDGLWEIYGYNMVEVDPTLCPEVTFENSPIEVKLSLEIK